MGELPPVAVGVSAVENMKAVESHHTNMVQHVLPSNYTSKEALLYSYKKSFNGFVARLTEEEAERISEMEDVVSVFENTIHHPQTTRSWDFLSFPEQVSRSNGESNTIVGVIDTGIWPDKIIGAKYFRVSGSFEQSDIISPRDSDGHGSHCASTAAGNVVGSASLFGLASGTARGGVPSARIAAYKVCWSNGCDGADILAAFDEAIADGVHIITISIGPTQVEYRHYYDDIYAIGSFHAMKNGILTSKSADNLGPRLYTMSNYAPWFLSVAASNTDRRFLTTLQLGNGRVYEGVSINTFNPPNTAYPLIYGGDAPNTAGGFSSSTSRLCSSNSLNAALVSGRIVLCDNPSPDQSMLLSNGVAGVVLRTNVANDWARIFALPATSLSLANGTQVLNYIRSTSNATGTILRSTAARNSLAPNVVSFSSRGPNPITPDLLKPDIAAPGVEILAAYSPIRLITGVTGDNRIANYSILSGTSMATPHVAAIAAYIKSFHPTWSPAAIKSAILTTATPMSSTLNPEAEFAYGAGQLNPTRAPNPGLIYNLSVSDYVRFLCGQGYDNTRLRRLTGDNSSCNQAQNEAAWNLNLPSFVLHRNNNQNFNRTYQRSVTNVGRGTSTYRATVMGASSPTLSVQVTPNVMSFSSVGETRSFTLTISGTTTSSIVSASLVWDDGTHQIYIVYMGELPLVAASVSAAESMEAVESHHTNMIQRVLPSYKKSFNGFVARLTEEEAERISEMEDVVSVFENTVQYPQTTRSWDFLGFPEHAIRSSGESNTIVGVIDTGIWPETDSFSAQGFAPPPSQWKGSCQNIACNNKIIGAKYFRVTGSFAQNDIRSPRDATGHGSHCASIAAGNVVGSKSLLGLGSGTVRGGVPSARIAVYKVCWLIGCDTADILAAFDEAIADGVHIISLSVAFNQVVHHQYYNDIFAIGSFHAMRRGILTSKAAGNLGSGLYTMPTLAPWLLSVAASNTDRRFVTALQLGNGMVYQGISINSFIPHRFYSLIYGGDAPNTAGGFSSSTSRLCSSNSLNAALVRGRIVLCDNQSPDQSMLLRYGVAGVVLRTNSAKDYARIFALPATSLNEANGTQVLSYIRSTSNPIGVILRSTEAKNSLAPNVVSFSSRGPNRITPDILKPDIAAPGVEILAANSLYTSITGVTGDNRIANYSILSGTSMAAPHVSAIAAYIKSFHPTWSPGAIKSAILTTATPMSSTTNPEAEFAYGAGQLNPTGALNPGLIYNLSASDYVSFLCGQGYDDRMLRLITRDYSSCTHTQNEDSWNLNLPSFVLFRNNIQNFYRVYRRSVTNVGRATSTYRVRVIGASSPTLNVQVTPNVMSFSSVGETRSFTLTIAGTTSSSIVSASLIWDDGTHQVRSPIVVYNL
ncbi:cucumisin-like protein [Senna tora]|uniref:Cucumisin-like protein n=1 Tax=Senna tora TaxID=362788 RepID=A0A834TYM3_9FABA|nr:cucumisin-like protein [Senna tora]